MRVQSERRIYVRAVDGGRGAWTGECRRQEDMERNDPLRRLLTGRCERRIKKSVNEYIALRIRETRRTYAQGGPAGAQTY